MEPHRGLVEDVDDPGQAGAHVGGEPESLALAPGQAVGGPVQGQVAEIQFQQRVDALPDLPEDVPHQLALAAVEFHLFDETAKVADGQGRDPSDVHAVDLHPEALAPQPGAGALRTRWRRGVRARGAFADLDAQALAPGAGPVRAVEGKELRRGLGERRAAVEAGGPPGVAAGPRVRGLVGVDPHGVAAVLQGHLDGVGQPLGRLLPHRQPVHHQVRPAYRPDLRGVGQFQQPAVHLHAHEPGAHRLLPAPPELAQVPAGQRGEHLDAGPRRELQHVVHHLLHRVDRDGAAADEAVGPARVGEQQPQVVVDLGQRAHGRAGVLVEAALGHGDGRGQAPDGLHVRPRQGVQELARVRGQGLHVMPLALGIDGVERQGGLAGARDPGDHHQLVPGDLHVHVLEVVDPRALDDDVHGDRLPPSPRREGQAADACPRRASSAASRIACFMLRASPTPLPAMS